MVSQIKTALRLLRADPPSRGYVLRRYVIIPITTLLLVPLGGLYTLWPGALPKLKRPIFIIGCSRSGTSVLVSLFAKHSHLANWSEASHVFDINYYHPDIDHVWSEQSGTPRDALRIKALFGLYTRLQGKPRFVNKHPQNSLRIRYLQQLFPDALFIHIVRDGRAVIHSNLQKTAKDQYRAAFPFGNFPKPPNWRSYLDLPLYRQFAHQWREVLECVQAAGCACAPDRFLEIRYEDLCADVHGTLRKLDAFCGLPTDERQYAQIPATLSSQNDKWKQSLDAEQLVEIEQVIGPQLLHYGYPLFTDVGPSLGLSHNGREAAKGAVANGSGTPQATYEDQTLSSNGKTRRSIAP